MNWGFIGASRIAAGYLIDAVRAQDGHKVTSVLSSDAARGADYARTHGIATSTTNLDDMLADPEIGAVYVSTTNELHFAQAMAAIDAGKHVLCEKPLAMTVTDAITMVRAARERGLVFGTNHHLRNAGSHLAIRELITSGAVGDVLSMRIHHAVMLPGVLQGWRINNPAAGGGVTPDIVVHDADTVRFHLGEDPAEVVAMDNMSGLGDGVEDNNMSVWSMPSGAMIMTHESFTHPHAKTGLEVHGTKGSITARNVMTQEPIGQITLTDADGSRDVPFPTYNLYVRSLGLFADAMNGKGAPSTTGEDGVKSLAVAAAVKEAATTGRRVAVDYGGL